MARLDEGMHETMGSRVKEYEAVLDRKSVMQTELDRLRDQVSARTGEWDISLMASWNNLHPPLHRSRWTTSRTDRSMRWRWSSCKTSFTLKRNPVSWLNDNLKI